MNIILVCGCGVLAAMLTVVLKKHNAEYAFLLSVFAVIVILLCILAHISASFAGLKNIFTGTNVNSEYIKVMLKCIGICFLTEFTCDCCKDASQTALSNIVLTAGRVCVLISAVPMFNDFLGLVLNLSGGI